MRVPRSIKTVVPLLALTLLGLPATAHKAPPNLDARVVDATFLAIKASYPSIDYGDSDSARDDREGTAEWTTFLDTGNCCENYLTASKDGRLMDFGGSYINFTDDDGKTWKSVRPQTPLLGGEGAIAMAPGGDVVGVQWDAYSGDHLLAFKYDVDDEKWIYAEMPVHAPFYDREWIASVPGPFTILGQKVPYVSFIKGAWPSKEAWFYSTDGINYDRVMSKFLDQTIAGGQGGRSWVPTSGTPDSDWIQPNTNTGIYPMGNGWALASPDVPFSDGEWAVLNPKTLTWETFAPRGGARGRYQVDSAGTLHNVISEEDHFLYRVSTDGHRTWKTVKVPLPKGHRIEEIDFRAHRALGIAAVAIHARDRKDDNDKDMLFKLDITKPTPRLTDFYEVGLGDASAGSGVDASAAQEARVDFETVTILPDGRVAMSYFDSTTGGGPAMAVQTDR